MLLKKKISNNEFRIMHGFMRLVDHIHPHVPGLAGSFGIEPGMTVVDYGCGPGRYAVEFSRLAGQDGKVIAVDLLEIALQETEKRMKECGADNIELKLAKGYDSGIPNETADIVFAVDMFHHVDPVSFLEEASRIAKPDGLLLISGGHQTRKSIKAAVAASGLWELKEETRQFLKYGKRPEVLSC